ncbi:MAG: DUF4142 domain-containing protein [Halomonas sp.]|nr:DUF4142 domain-containing protein [Halomonas sp.]MCC5882666.1 DUF4142 domain-containing protein [Halomonas sp.]
MKGFIPSGSIVAAVGLTCWLIANAAWAEIDRDELRTALFSLHAHQTELAELARDRAESDEVAQLGSTLERDHSILEEWLLAAGGHEEPPEQHSTAFYDNEAYEALGELDGEAFDEAFLAYQMDLHRAAIEYLERNRSPGDEQLDEFNNHLFVTLETLLVNGELIDSIR